MRTARKQQMTLMDMVRIVSEYTRTEEELRLAVADLINRGRVKLGGRYQHHKVVVS